jgi:hypothetical protein
MVCKSTKVQGGTMTWKIIDATKDSIEIIDDVITREVEWADDPTDDIEQAWDRVKELARKGEIAEKHLKEWGKLK